MRTGLWPTAALVAMLAGLAAAPEARAEELIGKPTAVSGDTLTVAGVTVRLSGIAAPAPDARCANGGRPWDCGREAMFAMAFEIAEHWVTCETNGAVPDGTMLADCRVGPYDLAAILVRKGWATATDARHATAARQARAAGIGIWQTR